MKTWKVIRKCNTFSIQFINYIKKTKQMKPLYKQIKYKIKNK